MTTTRLIADQITAADTAEERASGLVSEENNKRSREGDGPNPGKIPKVSVFQTMMEAVRRLTTTHSSDASPWQLHDTFHHAGWLSGVTPELIHNPMVNQDSTVALQQLMAIFGQINPPSSFVRSVDPHPHVLPSLSTIDTRLLQFHQPLLPPSPLVAAAYPSYATLLSTLQGNNSTTNSASRPSLELQLALWVQASMQQATNRSVLGGFFGVPAQHYSNDLLTLSTLQGGQVNQVPSTASFASSQERQKGRQQESDPKLDGLTLYAPEDRDNLSKHQMFLRLQIEYFRASQQDMMSITRGKNKPIALMQVGIRCRHCSHVAAGRRKKGSTYFPSNIMGIYQACQNLGAEHLQSGLCADAPPEIIERLVQLASNKHAASGVGKKYWADKAERLGLIDTEEGIRFAADIQK